MTEENTLPENGWAIRATRETKKHPKWEAMLESINLLNAHIDNDAWVGVDEDGTTRNNHWGSSIKEPETISIESWCSMTGNEPTLEEEVNAVEPEFDPDQPFEVSDDGVEWKSIKDSDYFMHYIGLDREGQHVIEGNLGFVRWAHVRNIIEFNAGMLGVGEHMIIKDPIALHLEDHLVRMTIDRRLFDMDTNTLLAGPDNMYLKGKKVNVKTEVTDI